MIEFSFKHFYKKSVLRDLFNNFLNHSLTKFKAKSVIIWPDNMYSLIVFFTISIIMLLIF